MTACFNPKPKEFDKIYYHFSDSSVPPKYHRSYTIVITKDEVECSVDVYGDVIAEKSYEFTQEKFDKLVQKTIGLQSGKYGKPMSGSTATYIELKNKDEVVHELTWYDDDKVKSKTLGFEKAIKACAPDLGQMLMTPYKK